MCFFSQIQGYLGGSLTLPAGIVHTLHTLTIHYGGLTEVTDLFPLLSQEVKSILKPLNLGWPSDLLWPIA